MATSGNGLEVKRFEPNDVAGEKTINPMLDWMKNFDVMSEFLMTSVMGNGSISIDLDFPLLAAKILSMAERMQGEFKAVITGTDTLTVAAGHVLMPDQTYSLGTYTHSLSAGDAGDILSITVTPQGSASWGWSNSFPAGCVSGQSLILPVAQPYKDGTTWRVRQLHLGSYVLAFPPASFISGYDATKTQSLDHLSGTLVWTTYKRCGGQS